MQNIYYKDGHALIERMLDRRLEPTDAVSDDGERIESAYLGTVMGIMPSGKDYMPFACSNVTPCPNCRGEGSLPNPKASHKQVIKYSRLRRRAWNNRQFPRAEQYSKKAQSYMDKIECPHCRGEGSVEAWRDAEFSQGMEDAAEAHRCWIESGDGDPCDMFLRRVIQIPSGCTVYRLPSYWASYLVNGDASGLEIGEKAEIDAFLSKEGITQVIDVYGVEPFARTNDANNTAGEIAHYICK